MSRTMSLSVVLLLAGASALASAQGYPNKPVRILVGYAPGGGADIRARMAGLGADVVGNSPEEAAALFKLEIAKYTKVAKAAHISAD